MVNFFCILNASTLTQPEIDFGYVIRSEYMNNRHVNYIYSREKKKKRSSTSLSCDISKSSENKSKKNADGKMENKTEITFRFGDIYLFSMISMCVTL